MLSLLLQGVAQSDVPQYDGRVHTGVASCASSVCHGSTTERRGGDVLQNEYVTWSRYDKHADAYKVLLTPESKRIARNLGLPNAHEAEICLDCHTDNVPVSQRGEQFDISDGVGCEACHGGSADWIAHHTVQEVPYEDNVANGLYPTDRVVARAELCLSCHLGTEKKFATHQIMGAGHPRLAFELSTFTDLMPPHWATDSAYELKGSSDPLMATWITGLLTSARHTLAILERRLDHQAGLFPEVAVFDCHACHHPMGEKRWATTRITKGVAPGSIRLNDAQFALLLPVAEAVSREAAAALLSALRALNESVNADLAAFRAASKELRAAVDKLAQILEQPLGMEVKQRCLSSITLAGARGDFQDYVLAEQAAMALNLLLDRRHRDTSQHVMDRVFAAVDDEDRFEPKDFADAVGDLRAVLVSNGR